MSSLAQLLRPVRGRLVAAVGVQVVGSVAGIVPFVAVAELGRALLEPSGRDRVWPIVVVALGALVLRMVCYLVSGVLTHLSDVDFQWQVRRRIVAALGRLPLGWFGERNSGRVKKAVTDDVAAMHHLVGHALLDITNGIVVPVVSLGYLSTVDLRMTLVTIVPLAVGLGCYLRAMTGYRRKMAEFDEALGKVSHAVVEFVEGIAVVKAFGATGRAHRRFTESTREFVTFFLGWVTASMRASTAAEVVLSPVVTLLAVLVGGTVFVAQGSLAPVDVLPFALVGLAITAPVFTLGQNAVKLRAARMAASQVLTTLATPALPDPVDPVEPRGGDVVFRNVRFSYDGRTDVLAGIDLAMPTGTVTALVGPSGSGKSTLARLLPRFWDVTAGSVTIGGADVREIDLARLYRTVSFVLQDVQLLRVSVLDNIRLAVPDADDEAVYAAARAARIHDRILALPRGYGSVVGEDARLSGGERQRLSIARALLADTPVLVLDEATAFADPESEAAIQDGLAELAAGRTVLVIAHRLETITDADRIVVLDGGRVAEQGRHADLLDRGGRYARLWAAQDHSVTWSVTP